MITEFFTEPFSQHTSVSTNYRDLVKIGLLRVRTIVVIVQALFTSKELLEPNQGYMGGVQPPFLEVPTRTSAAVEETCYPMSFTMYFHRASS